MSFDIHLIKFSKGEACELPRTRIQDVLATVSSKQLSDGFYSIDLPGGSHVEFSARGLSGSHPLKSCVFLMRGMSDAIVRLLFEMASAAGSVLIPTMEKNPCILVNADQRLELPSDFKLPLVECSSVEELMRLLTGGYENWTRYRDQVVRRDA
jgi:hypothetical protein